MGFYSRRLIQSKVYYKLFYFVSKEASHKPLKVAAAKKSFPSVFIIDTTYFDECFLFHVTTVFFIVTQGLGATAMLLHSLKQVFWKKSSFMPVIFAIMLQWCLHQTVKIKLLFLKFSQKRVIYWERFFYTLSFCNFSL